MNTSISNLDIPANGSPNSEWTMECPQNVSLSLVILWPIVLIFSFVNLSFGIYLVIKTIYDRDNNRYNIDKLLLTLIIILFIASGALASFNMCQSIFCLSPSNIWLIFSISHGICYILGLSLIYLLYVLRLKHIFIETKYKLSKIAYGVFIAAFFLQILAPGCLTYLLKLPGWSPSCNAYSLFILSNFMFNMSLLFTFCHRIYIIGQDIIQANGNNKTIHEQLRQLLTPTIRYIVCASTVMLSSNLLSILGFYRSLFDTQLLWVSHITLITIDQTVNILALYLQYEFSTYQYENWCSYTHQFIYKISIHAIDKTNSNIDIKMEVVQTKNNKPIRSETNGITNSQTTTTNGVTTTSITTVITNDGVPKLTRNDITKCSECGPSVTVC